MKRSRLVWLFLGLSVTLAASLCMGRYPLRPAELLAILTGRCADPLKVNVFLNIRLPRTFLVCIGGMALSLAGWVYQSIFMNTLVSPDVLGVSGGCSVGAILAILTGAGAAMTQVFSLTAGIAVVLLTMLLARCIGRHDNVAMLLSGIVVGALANSVIMLLKYTADPHNELAAIEYWMMGSFHTAKWDTVCAVLPVFVPCCILILFLKNGIRLLSLGDEEALSLGVRPGPVKYLALFAATGAVASVVSVAGSVSWLGLIVPHIVRIGGGETEQTPYETLLAGALLLTVADLAARTLTASEIPISILTSFMGAVFLLILLVKKRGNFGRNGGC